MKTLTRLLMLAAMVLACAALAQNRNDYSGSYAVSGKNPDGSTYSGSMLVSSYGDGYRVTASLGGETWRGIASDIGDYLAVALLAGANPLITVYKVTAANTLEGFWQSYAEAKEGAEIATLRERNFSFVPTAPAPTTRVDFAGGYNISGKNPDGSAYTGNMVLTAFGDGYRVAFVSGNESWIGVATDIGNFLVVAYKAGDTPTVSIFERKADGSLSGYWQDYTDQKEGSETAVRR
jgi:hypothetical protein